MAEITLIDAETDGEQSDTFFIYNSWKGRKKDGKLVNIGLFSIKFKVNIVNKLFSHWALQYTLVILSD